MLYDHVNDPGENVNIAEAEPKVADALTIQLHEQTGRDDAVER